MYYAYAIYLLIIHRRKFGCGVCKPFGRCCDLNLNEGLFVECIIDYFDSGYCCSYFDSFGVGSTTVAL